MAQVGSWSPEARRAGGEHGLTRSEAVLDCGFSSGVFRES